MSLGYKERYDVYSLIEHTQIDPIVKLGLVKIILFLSQEHGTNFILGRIVLMFCVHRLSFLFHSLAVVRSRCRKR